ncbi:RagB/SusD family nutrient uptake outer membrane protein [Urechidicola croceus]|nr:RagB/SusD family nutrient uptake outer membrane protein [Urechidicola croceus]
MKKYLLILTVLAVTFISCDDELETFPTSQIAADAAFKNEGDFTNALYGMYNDMLQSVDPDGNVKTYYGGALQGYDVMSDNLIISQEGRFSQQFRHDWTYDANGGFSLYLQAVYTVIQDANFILENIDVLEDSSFKNNVKGEALAARALAHFDIVRFFGKIPTQSSDANSSLAMPYVTTPDVNELPARITVSEYYGNLVSDLTSAASLINSSNNGNLQMGKDAVNGILARVYLHMGNWQGAINAANAVSTSVASRSSFTGIWDDSNEDGVIFKLDNDDVTRVTLGVPYNQTTGGIKDEYVPDFEFFQMFDASDIRLTAYMQPNGEFGGSNYNHIIKWYSSVTTTSLGVVDAKVLRASEVMLTKAEAHAELNQDGPALTALDAVRSQRYSGFVSGGESGQELKDAIAKERRLELAFEGSRFTDIKRYGIDVQRSEFGHFADGSGVPATFKTLPASDNRFQVPIPLTEMQLNPNMVQNPGYGD